MTNAKAPKHGIFRRGMATVGQPEAGRRIRAARWYKGISSVGKLAALLPRGLGTTKVYALERGEQPLRRQDALAIAEVCDLDVAFFEVDFQRLSELLEPRPGDPPSPPDELRPRP